jgi:small-conductance mechanosensitive channel
MIQIGDWIQLPDGSANGTVEEITLNTVKVRNWDNTLSMIPPYTLVSTPFKNWRGMQESGGRRVDKMIYIDVNTLQIRAEDDGVTNVQRYREYIETYLRQHPYVNASLDLIITQKEATPYGLPIEVYFFTKEKNWAAYEKQQSEIFDHLMTVVTDFGLQLYQRP